jgi:hypothetical protein
MFALFALIFMTYMLVKQMSAAPNTQRILSMENNVFKGKTPHKKGSSHTDL